MLDHMNFQHGLQHLDIKPGNLFLIANHVKVADFGLVQSLTDTRGPRHSVPGRHHAALCRSRAVPQRAQPVMRPVQPGHRLPGTADGHAALRRQEFPATDAAALHRAAEPRSAARGGSDRHCPCPVQGPWPALRQLLGADPGSAKPGRAAGSASCRSFANG